MDIDIIFSAGEVNTRQIEGRTVVVIDVLRATSVMVTALYNGAHRVLPVLTPEEGFALKKTNDPAEIILGGERNADHIPGFDFGNSPLDYTHSNVAKKTVVMTTTNGTRAIHSALTANELYVAAFLNAQAMATHLSKHEKITLFCSGSNEAFTIEDALCAGYITHLLLKNNPSTSCSDAALALNQLHLSTQQNLLALASRGRHYKILKAKGHLADLEYCFEKDILPVVCQWKGADIGMALV
jgi:2-phosphosulfolactate phosphatase